MWIGYEFTGRNKVSHAALLCGTQQVEVSVDFSVQSGHFDVSAMCEDWASTP